MQKTVIIVVLVTLVVGFLIGMFTQTMINKKNNPSNNNSSTATIFDKETSILGLPLQKSSFSTGPSKSGFASTGDTVNATIDDQKRIDENLTPDKINNFTENVNDRNIIIYIVGGSYQNTYKKTNDMHMSFVYSDDYLREYNIVTNGYINYESISKNITKDQSEQINNEMSENLRKYNIFDYLQNAIVYKENTYGKNADMSYNDVVKDQNYLLKLKINGNSFYIPTRYLKFRTTITVFEGIGHRLGDTKQITFSKVNNNGKNSFISNMVFDYYDKIPTVPSLMEIDNFGEKSTTFKNYENTTSQDKIDKITDFTSKMNNIDYIMDRVIKTFSIRPNSSNKITIKSTDITSTAGSDVNSYYMVFLIDIMKYINKNVNPIEHIPIKYFKFGEEITYDLPNTLNIDGVDVTVPGNSRFSLVILSDNLTGNPSCINLKDIAENNSMVYISYMNILTFLYVNEVINDRAYIYSCADCFVKNFYNTTTSYCNVNTAKVFGIEI